MTARQPITDKMKIASLRFWGQHLCPECHVYIEPERAIEWDHRTALIHGGGHDHTNIRMIHADCHRRLKTPRDVKAQAKVKRIATGGRKRKGPKIAGRGFPKKPEGHVYKWRKP